MFTEEQKIAKGKEIQNSVEKLGDEWGDFKELYKQKLEEYQKNMQNLRESCLEHKWKWFDTNPYNEDCRCIYCDFQSPRTR
jgi:uncharacterized protein YeaO (DUF488 family)